MRVLKPLKPGQEATKGMLVRHGSSLICVRYRYDKDTRERLKTVELIVHRRSREPPTENPGPQRTAVQVRGAALRGVALRIGRRERKERSWVKATGSHWDQVRRLWLLRRDIAERLESLHRVVG